VKTSHVLAISRTCRECMWNLSICIARPLWWFNTC